MVELSKSSLATNIKIKDTERQSMTECIVCVADSNG